MRRLGIDHVLRVGPLLVVAVVEVQHVQHRLGIVLLLLLADVRRQQEPLPCLGHSLEERERSVAFGQFAGTRIN